MDKQAKALEIMKRLYAATPHPKVELQYSTPFELLVATILSAQCTDKLVNAVSPALFAKFKTPEDYARSSPEEINSMILRVNFHNNKAKNIYGTAKAVVERFGGTVPHTMDELLTLPGVARKTANVILGSAYGIPSGIVVDTHGIRLANRLGLTASRDPVVIEKELMTLIPEANWIDFGQLLTLHGRHQCPARPHECTGCPLGDLCPEYPAV